MSVSRTEVARVAGRALDAEIAEKVMGLCVHEWTFRTVDEWMGDWEASCEKCGQSRVGAACDLGPVSGRVEPYSREITAAWEVAEKVGEGGMEIVIWSDEYMGTGGKFWSCKIGREVELSDATLVSSIDAATAPLAICLAALNAMEGVS